MKGLIMDYPLTLTQLFERSRKLFHRKTMATRVPGTGLQRYTYADYAERVCRLSAALAGLGLKKGDRVGTFAWNSHRHMEVYFAAPLMGMVLHTVNIRLSPQDLTYIINHAEDQVLIVDASLWPLLEPIRKDLKSVKHVIVMKDAPTAEIPEGALDYEELLAAARPVETWPTLNETDAAGMCYTSGTTGHPKGVLYTHRGIYLHCFGSSTVDVLGICERDVILHIVPMFHANAWCVPFAGVMNGSTQIFGGPNPQPRDIIEIVHHERVTLVGAVPTVWIAIQAILEKEPQWDISSIRCIPIGGSAAPKTLIEHFDKKYGAYMLHAWGMTEMSPLGSVCRPRSYTDSLPEAERYNIRAKQGAVVAGVDMRIVDELGAVQPWDGKSVGEIQVRGPWVTSGYYNNPSGAAQFTEDGWFRTGDVAAIDAEGYIQITDRTKDLIKSGGEWISSVDMETTIMGHPKVLEAAVIAVPHPRWQERPLACVVPKPEFKDQLTESEILDYLRPLVAKWWLPDEVRFIEAVPKTSVGKFDKKVLRERFKNWEAESLRSAMLIVDAQIHLWKNNKPTNFANHRQITDYTADDALREMDEGGVNAALIHPPGWDPDSNALAVEAATAHPSRFAILGNFPLDQPESRAKVAEMKGRPGVLGLRYALLRPHQQTWLTDGSLDWLWAAAERTQLPIALLGPGLFQVIGPIAERHRGLKLIIDHFGRPDAEWSNLPDLVAAAKHPNVALKATGAPSYSSEPYPHRDIHGHIRKLYDAFGPERMFWGTDITRMPCPWKQCVTMFTEEMPWLSEKDKGLIMGRAVCDWFGWKLAG